MTRRRADAGRPGGVEVELEEACVEPDADEREDDESDRDRERAPAPPVRRATNGATAISAAPNSAAPIAAHASTEPSVVAREDRCDREGEGPEPDRQEAAGEQEIHRRDPRRETGSP